MKNRIPLDYRSVMHRCALVFLEQHQAQYLSGDQALYSRTVAHLRYEKGVEAELAHIIGAQAYGEFRSAGERRHLNMASSSASVLVLNDPANGLTHVVPVATVFRLIIDSPDRRHLRAVH